MFSFGAGMNASLDIGKSFGDYDPTTVVWIAAAYPYVEYSATGYKLNVMLDLHKVHLSS
jgi:hypothetical protein